MQSMKLDYDPAASDLFSLTWSRQEDLQTGFQGLATPNANWPQNYRTFVTRGNVVALRYEKIFSPTLVNELVLGNNWRPEHETVAADDLAKQTRAAVGFKV